MRTGDLRTRSTFPTVLRALWGSGEDSLYFLIYLCVEWDIDALAIGRPQWALPAYSKYSLIELMRVSVLSHELWDEEGDNSSHSSHSCKNTMNVCESCDEIQTPYLKRIFIEGTITLAKPREYQVKCLNVDLVLSPIVFLMQPPPWKS